MMIPNRITIATEKLTVLAPEPVCSCEPIQTHPSGTPKPMITAAMTVAKNVMTCSTARMNCEM